MNALTQDHLEVVEGEPRVRDLDLAERLGFHTPGNLRRLIKRNSDEFVRYGFLASVAKIPDRRGGRPGTEYWLNEPQALLVCMFARTRNSADVREQLIRVFMAWRRGELGSAAEVAELRERQAALEAEMAAIRRWLAAAPGQAPADASVPAVDDDGCHPAPVQAPAATPAGSTGEAPATAADRRAAARAILVRAVQDFRARHALGLEQARTLFAEHYNDGGMEVPAWVRTTVSRTSRNSLKNWEKRLARDGAESLAGAYGNRRGDTVVDRDPAVRAAVEEVLAARPDANASDVMAALRTRFDPARLPASRSLQRWLRQWRDGADGHAGRGDTGAARGADRHTGGPA